MQRTTPHCAQSSHPLYYLGALPILIHWTQLFTILIHWAELYPILIDWAELYTILILWPELYPILILCRAIPYLNTLSRTMPHLNTLNWTKPYLNTLPSAADQNRVIRHPSRQPIRIDFMSPQSSRLRLKTLLGSRLESARVGSL